MTAPSPTPDTALTEVEGYADHTSCVESYTALLNRETALRQAAADLVEELDANARNLWHDAAGRAVNSAQVGAADQASRIAERVSRALLAQHATPSDPPQGEDVDRCPECRHAPHGSVGFCPNMASDNDCACTYRDPAPAESRDAQSGVAEVLAEVLAEHQYREVRGDYEIAPYYRHFGCTCGWEQNIAGMSGWRSWVAAHVTHVAAMQAAALAPLLAADRAKVLREAAEDLAEFARETYPVDVFPKPTAEQYEALNSLGHAHMRSGAECYRHAIGVQAARLRDRAAAIEADR